MSKNNTIEKAMNDLYYELDSVLTDRQEVNKEYVIGLIHRTINALDQCKDKG